jgi:cytochrome bd ubiquinol oxidase subunit I
LYNGSEGAGLVALGLFSTSETDPNNENLKDFTMKIEIPNFLSYMAFLDWNAFVPGINDLINGNEKYGYMSAAEKIERGKLAISKLFEFKEAKKTGNETLANNLRAELTSDDFQQNYFKYFGYGYFEDVNDLVPNVPITFYSFHLMVGLGFLFLLLFILSLVYLIKGTLTEKRWLLRLAILAIPLAYLAGQLGWIVAEMGRQPWVVQDLMPTMAGVTRISAGSVQTTFWLFVVLFTILLIAELKIMFRQIKIGPKH